MTFCVWFLSFSIRLSRFIHAVVCIKTSFLLITKDKCIVWIDLILFINLSFYGHLSCFPFLSIMNNAAVNILVQVFVLTCVFNSFGLKPVCHYITLCVTC